MEIKICVLRRETINGMRNLSTGDHLSVPMAGDVVNDRLVRWREQGG